MIITDVTLLRSKESYTFESTIAALSARHTHAQHAIPSIIARRKHALPTTWVSRGSMCMPHPASAQSSINTCHGNTATTILRQVRRAIPRLPVLLVCPIDYKTLHGAALASYKDTVAVRLALDKLLHRDFLGRYMGDDGNCRHYGNGNQAVLLWNVLGFHNTAPTYTSSPLSPPARSP